MNTAKLQTLIEDHGIAYGIVADLNKDIFETVGDITILTSKDLVEQLFGDMEQIRLLNNSLEGQKLPRSWKQGAVRCLVSKTKPDVLIGLFYNENRPLFESIDFGNRIHELIIKSQI